MLELELQEEYVKPVAEILRKHGMKELADRMVQSVMKYGARKVDFTPEEWSLDILQAVAPVVKLDRKVYSFVQALIHAKAYGTAARVRKLELLPKMMCEYLIKDAIDGWIYKEVDGGVCVAYLVFDIRYCYGDRQNPPYVAMELKANKMEFQGEDRDGRDDGLQDLRITWEHGDLGKTCFALLTHEGWLKETPELKAAYLKDMQMFEKLCPQEGKQFLCTGQAIEAEVSNWWRNGDTDRYPLPHPAKMVNEEEVLGRKIKLTHWNSFWRDYKIKETGPFSTIPVHPFILMFDLQRHKHVWMHVGNIKEYKYDRSLRDKLVLPPAHRDLIDVLTEDMDVFVEDIVAGKSGGTAILCYGEPGLGKTLTAEVYSELVERPLYRVAAGQLGTDVATVEKALEKILRRAERWGAVLLLDEADVYIRKRSNDIHHNAVVAAFLRTLEYFHGLLFMTTNRATDVDEAIASRMVATFKYTIPDRQMSLRLWSVLATQFDIPLAPKMFDELVEAFPDMAGRDIKELLKLTMKYCKKKNKKMNVDAFRVCAMFRGIL